MGWSERPGSTCRGEVPRFFSKQNEWSRRKRRKSRDDFPYETWGYDDYEAFIEKESDIDKVMNLIKQAYSQS